MSPFDKLCHFGMRAKLSILTTTKSSRSCHEVCFEPWGPGSCANTHTVVRTHWNCRLLFQASYNPSSSTVDKKKKTIRARKLLPDAMSGTSFCRCGSLFLGSKLWMMEKQLMRFLQIVHPRYPPITSLFCGSSGEEEEILSLQASPPLCKSTVCMLSFVCLLYYSFLFFLLPGVWSAAAACSSSTAARRHPHTSHSPLRWSLEGSSEAAESPAQWRGRPGNSWRSPLALPASLHLRQREREENQHCLLEARHSSSFYV